MDYNYRFITTKVNDIELMFKDCWSVKFLIPNFNTKKSLLIQIFTLKMVNFQFIWNKWFMVAIP